MGIAVARGPRLKKDRIPCFITPSKIAKGESMTKSDLIRILNSEFDITRQEASKVVNVFFNEMSNALANGERVEIRGLCSFYVKKYREYTGRNPKTGTGITVKPKILPSFKCGKELKDRVNI